MKLRTYGRMRRMWRIWAKSLGSEMKFRVIDRAGDSDFARSVDMSMRLGQGTRFCALVQQILHPFRKPLSAVLRAIRKKKQIRIRQSELELRTRTN